MKRCSKCGVEKALDEFHKAKKSKDGRGGWCKQCSNRKSERSKERDRLLLLGIKVCNKCQEKKRLEDFGLSNALKGGKNATCKVCSAMQTKARRFAHPEKARTAVKAYRARYPDRVRETAKKCKLKNPGMYQRQSYVEAKKRYIEANRRDISKRQLKWAKENPEKRRIACKKCATAARQELSDSYVREILVGKDKSLRLLEFPQQLIELKRDQLFILRAVKQLKKTIRGKDKS